MRTCILCRFEASLDDTAVPTGACQCICLRCFGRETETSKPMP